MKRSPAHYHKCPEKYLLSIIQTCCKNQYERHYYILILQPCLIMTKKIKHCLWITSLSWISSYTFRVIPKSTTFISFHQQRENLKIHNFNHKDLFLDKEESRKWKKIKCLKMKLPVDFFHFDSSRGFFFSGDHTDFYDSVKIFIIWINLSS